MGRSGRDNRSRGHGGRGRGRYQGRGRSKNSSSLKELEMKFFPHGKGKDWQTVMYDTVKDHIVQYIQKTYKNGQDIRVSLQDLQKKDLDPIWLIQGSATGTDDAAKKTALDGLDIIYQAEITRYLKCKEMLAKNLSKAYTLIFSTYCNKIMQHRIEEHPDFNGKIQNIWSSYCRQSKYLCMTQFMPSIHMPP